MDDGPLALRDAFAAGAFPALTDLRTPIFDRNEVEYAVALLHVLEARATLMLELVIRTIRLSQVGSMMLADALSAPAFASLHYFYVQDSEASIHSLDALRANAGKHLQHISSGVGGIL